MSILPQARKNNIVVQELNNETLIYDLKTNKAYCLNHTSALIWNLCDGTNSVTEISHILSQKMNQLVNDDLVWLALDQLKSDNLLEQSNEFKINYQGLTRREVIRKIGFASLVTLPIISA